MKPLKGALLTAAALIPLCFLPVGLAIAVNSGLIPDPVSSTTPMALKVQEEPTTPPGYFVLEPGIYGRWCTETDTCSQAGVIGNQSFWLLEVWAKDRSAGDIYGRVNIFKDDVVIGWTNDTAYLSKGQKGVMTFAKRLPAGSSYSAQLTEFNSRP